MTERAPIYELDQARANILWAEANRLNAEARAFLDALSSKRMALYRAMWQGDEGARLELRGLHLALAALASGLDVEVRV